MFEIPNTVADKKYAPKNESGYEMCYSSNGRIAITRDEKGKKKTDKKGKPIRKTLLVDYLSMYKDYRVIQRY